MIHILLNDYKQAMRDKAKIKKDIIQIVRANITNLAKDRRITEDQLTNEDILGVISKEVKQQNDSLEAFKNGNRLDLVEGTEKKIEILMGYLPKQLTREEIEVLVKETVVELGVENLSGKEKGRLMKELMPKVKGKADGKLVNEVVVEMLK